MSADLSDLMIGAQVAITDNGSWHVFRGNLSAVHSLKDDIPLPDLPCPILDLARIPTRREPEVGTIIKLYKDGQLDVHGLIERLTRLGAKVTNAPCATCEGNPKNCTDCPFGGNQS